MSTVKKSDVPISLRYLVDCNVCNEGVNQNYELTTRAEAVAARDEHIRQHKNGDWDD